MGPFDVNGEESRGYRHGVPATDHGEESEAIVRRKLGDAGGGMRTRGRRNPVNEDLHIAATGKRGAVGGATYLI